MRILNEADEEIQSEDVDNELGYLVPDKVFKEHHDAEPPVEEKVHYYPTTFFFDDGTRYDTVLYDYLRNNPDKNSEEDLKDYQNDAHVVVGEDGFTFSYEPKEEEEERAVKRIEVATIVDSPYVPAKEAWDEYEDIQRYKLYAEEELQQRKEQQERQEKRDRFMNTGPDRLDNAESNIDVVSTNVDDITMLLADMIGA